MLYKMISHFLLCSLLTFTTLLSDLSPPPLPIKKLPPRLPNEKLSPPLNGKPNGKGTVDGVVRVPELKLKPGVKPEAWADAEDWGGCKAVEPNMLAVDDAFVLAWNPLVVNVADGELNAIMPLPLLDVVDDVLAKGWFGANEDEGDEALADPNVNIGAGTDEADKVEVVAEGKKAVAAEDSDLPNRFTGFWVLSLSSLMDAENFTRLLSKAEWIKLQSTKRKQRN